MAIFHFSAQVLKRSPIVKKDGTTRPGSNAVAAAAYRAGEKLHCSRTDTDHDYSRRGGVAHREIMAPEHGPDWLRCRELLWNAVEGMEKRVDAQLAREINIALPCELSHAQRVDLVRGFVGEQFVKRGMVADIAWHDPIPEHGQNARNFHAHIMLTLRRATAGGLEPVKTREWNSRDMMKLWREAWAVACNRALERAGQRSRIDHRTLAAQRHDAAERGDWKAAKALDRQPEIHVGVRAKQLVRKGWTPQSQAREVGAVHRRGGSTEPERRQRDYARHDQGTRIAWLGRIMAGNDVKLRTDFTKMNRQVARFRRKVDYWDRQATFWTESGTLGKDFRFNRWKAGQEDRQRCVEATRKVEHARHREAQINGIIQILERMLAGARRGREDQLVRARDIESWRQPSGRRRESPPRGRA